MPDGGTADVYFKFEKNPYPDTDPSYSTSVVTISGNNQTQYTIDIPSLGSNTIFIIFILHCRS